MTHRSTIRHTLIAAAALAVTAAGCAPEPAPVAAPAVTATTTDAVPPEVPAAAADPCDEPGAAGPGDGLDQPGGSTDERVDGVCLPRPPRPGEMDGPGPGATVQEQHPCDTSTAVIEDGYCYVDGRWFTGTGVGVWVGSAEPPATTTVSESQQVCIEGVCAVAEDGVVVLPSTDEHPPEGSIPAEPAPTITEAAPTTTSAAPATTTAPTTTAAPATTTVPVPYQTGTILRLVEDTDAVFWSITGRETCSEPWISGGIDNDNLCHRTTVPVSLEIGNTIIFPSPFRGNNRVVVAFRERGTWESTLNGKFVVFDLLDLHTCVLDDEGRPLGVHASTAYRDPEGRYRVSLSVINGVGPC